MRRIRIVAAFLAISACASAPSIGETPVEAAGNPVCVPDAALIVRDEAALLALVPCLDHPDPAIRDGYAFGSLTGSLRGGTYAPETLRRLKAALSTQLEKAGADPGGFRGPFAILALSEVARTDRIAPWMSETERGELIRVADAYFEGLTDYRGYSDTEGWRHGVAHAADLLMQLSLNPQLTKPQGEQILAAVARKVGTPEHAFVFGESERLAAPVMYLAQKDMFTEAEWAAWFNGLWPADDALRKTVYASEAGLTKLHNLRAFGQAVYVNADASDATVFAPVRQAALALLTGLP